jgi:hypothetical protein
MLTTASGYFRDELFNELPSSCGALEIVGRHSRRRAYDGGFSAMSRSGSVSFQLDPESSARARTIQQRRSHEAGTGRADELRH